MATSAAVELEVVVGVGDVVLAVSRVLGRDRDAPEAGFHVRLRRPAVQPRP